MPGAPKHALLELTFRCNQRCRFCYLPWLEDEAMLEPELAIDAWIDVVERLIRHGVAHFTLSGGEPLMKPEIGRLLDHLIAHPAKPAFTIYTNGSLVDEALLAKLAGTRGDLALSLPGLKQFPKLTDSSRTVYDMIDLFAAARRAGVGFSVGITVTRPALREVADLVALAATSGAKAIQVVPFLAEGRGAAHPEMLLRYDEILALGRRVETLNRKLATPLYSSNELFCSCRGRCTRPPGTPADYVPPECHTEERTIVVGPAGRCRKCMHTFESIGDVCELYA